MRRTVTCTHNWRRIWYLAWQFKCNLEKTCLECDDFLQLCQVDSDFPNFISFIIRTKYRIECLLSNVSRVMTLEKVVCISKYLTKFQMFRSAYRSGRMHVCQFGHRKGKTKWGHWKFFASLEDVISTKTLLFQLSVALYGGMLSLEAWH